MALWSAELERVLQQIRDRRREQLPVAINRQVAIDRMHRQLHPIGLGMHGAG